MNTIHRSVFLLAVVGLAVVHAAAQDSPERMIPADAGAATKPAVREWTLYSSPETGFEAMLPPGTMQASEDPNDLAVVVDAARGWRFELRRLPLEMPMELQPVELPEGGRRPGLLSLLMNRAAGDHEAHVIRQGLVPLGSADAAVFALYYQVGTVGQLRQEAVVQASDTLYYQVVLISPAPADAVNGAVPDPSGKTDTALAQALAGDENVREAVSAFTRSVNSFKLLDQTQLRQEQDERLIRTRTLLVNLTKARLMDALQPERFVRVIKDGRDIGYSYIVEELAREIPADPARRESVDELGARGVRIGVRTRLRRGEGFLGRETWMFAASESNNREAQVTGFKEEDFRERNQLVADGKLKGDNVVVGMMRGRRVPQRVRVPREGGLGTTELIDLVDARKLEVTTVVNGVQTDAPMVRQLPAWYIPAAVEHLLPRIAARWGKNTYLVAVYNPEKREIYQQYLDVEGLKNENIQGQTRLVIVVTTRLGLSGPRTRHFIDPEAYTWLGSVNEESKVELWPSDKETLIKIWENPELSPPDARATALPEPARP